MKLYEDYLINTNNISLLNELSLKQKINVIEYEINAIKGTIAHIKDIIKDSIQDAVIHRKRMKNIDEKFRELMRKHGKEYKGEDPEKIAARRRETRAYFKSLRQSLKENQERINKLEEKLSKYNKKLASRQKLLRILKKSAIIGIPAAAAASVGYLFYQQHQENKKDKLSKIK